MLLPVLAKTFAGTKSCQGDAMSTSQSEAASESKTLMLFVRQIRYEGKNIQSYELVDPAGNTLPAFTAGAHIDIHLANGVIRQYSLCNSPGEGHRYVFAVLRNESERGGSEAVHEQLHVQDRVRVSRPRNNFELDDAARKVILLAGGNRAAPPQTDGPPPRDAGPQEGKPFSVPAARP